jgi:hypothetical protein
MAQGALESYFSHLSHEFHVEGENLTVVVDNAHIPLHFEEEALKPAFSQSLSALDNTRFPPQFLKDDDRWNSMQSSAASDVSLNMPSRSRDTLDERIDRMITKEKKMLAPQASLDATERMLRELPLELPDHTRTRITRKQNRNAPRSPLRRKDDELPSLKHCPYSEEIEGHPSVGLRRLPESVALGLTDLVKTGSTAFTLLDEDGGDSHCSVSDGHSPELSDNAALNLNSQHPNKVRLSYSRWIYANSTEMPSNEELLFKRRDLKAIPSPKAISDFPKTKKSGGPNGGTRRTPSALSPKSADGARKMNALEGSLRSQPSMFQACHF